MRKFTSYAFASLLLLCCTTPSEIQEFGLHYQKYKDYENLNKVVDRIQLNVADTSYLKTILGQPINFDFDYRYLIDSIGPNGCLVGAVFHINNKGQIDQKFFGEICE